MLTAISVRLDAVWHWLRGHDVRWRVNADEVCPGDIVCEKCPDCEDPESTGMVLWCRTYDPWRKFRKKKKS
jgi:hypothetical protein